MRSPLLISHAWTNAKEEETVSNAAAASRKRILPIVFVTTLLLLACLPVARAHAEEGDTSTNLPASFDLRNVDGHCYVTPVKFQNPFGTC